MDLNKIEGNFFHKLDIKKFEYNLFYRQHALPFPIELIKGHKILEELYISLTHVDLPLEDFIVILRTLKLRIVELLGNRITSAEPFVDLPTVEQIDLRSNNIRGLPANSFSGCPKLTYLNLADNPLSTLKGNEFKLLTGLKELLLSYTDLTSIAPNIFHPLKSLEKLKMLASFIGDQFIIEKELFMHSRNLTYLDLWYFKITAIHPEAFDNLKSINRLHLWGNKCVDREFRAG
jgi:Leucine-rich repeat (LRR) protein